MRPARLGRSVQFRSRLKLFRALSALFVTGADSRANHYHSELIRRRRVSKRLFPLVLAIAALSIVRVRALESAPVTRNGPNPLERLKIAKGIGLDFPSICLDSASGRL